MVTRNHPGIVATIDELKPAGVEVAQEIKPNVSATNSMRNTGPTDELSDTNGGRASTNHVRAVLVPIPATVMDQDRATRAAASRAWMTLSKTISWPSSSSEIREA